MMIYVQEDKKYEHTWHTGPEIQVADNDGNEDGKIIKHQAGDLYDLISCSKKTVKPAGEWNKVEIISNKGHLTLMLNGAEVISTTLWGDHWKQLIATVNLKTCLILENFNPVKLRCRIMATWFISGTLRLKNCNCPGRED
jgi:hypothetical protein